jgi:transposase
MGKPKLTYELIDTAQSLKADGLSNKDICLALGIHESTFYRWLQNPTTKLQRELNESLKKAESEYKQTLLNTIRRAALKNECNWTAAAWLLERKYPDEFGKSERKAQEAHTDAPQLVLGVKVARIESADGDCGCSSEASAILVTPANSTSAPLREPADE